MRTVRVGQTIVRLTIAATAALLLVAVVALMNHVQSLLASDTQINLTEVVTQNKDVISSRLNAEVASLDSVAMQISDRLNRAGGEEALATSFLDYCATNEAEDLFVAPLDGQALFPDGSVIDVAGRRYFQLSQQGTKNISDRVISRITGDEVFIFSVPLYYGGEIVATMQKQVSSDEMYTICEISLFSDQGSVSIIKSDGYVVVGASSAEYSQESSNYYRILYAAGAQDAAKQLQSDMEQGRSGFMETVENSETYFSVYTPLEDIHDWNLITSVSTKAVSPNASIVIKLFYVILLMIVVAYTVSLVLFFWYKRRQAKKLEYAAFVDSVTDGDTFARFVLGLEEMLELGENRLYYLISFDIDKFRYINSYYGFDFGDAVLKKVHDAVKVRLLPGEMLARVSGDHFVALLFDACDERLEAMMKSANAHNAVEIYLSVGVYHIEDTSESPNLMVDKASMAALNSKDSLQKRVERYSAKYDEQLTHNEQLKRAVEQALASSEFVPYYQPKVNIDTGELVGAEALVRWKKPDGSLVPPSDFIPLCEQTGLVVELDMLVLRKVLAFLKSNLDGGLPCVPISVNFSRLHLLNPQFLSAVSAELDHFGVPAHLIEMELTESVVFDSPETMIEFVTKVHECGLRISMDDFGSGYSSLNMLKDIPIDVLKVDQGFLRETKNSKRLAVIFAAVARMARDLSIDVVVEGVETAENVELMRSNGCLVAQGYYFARPMDEQSFRDIFERGTLW